MKQPFPTLSNCLLCSKDIEPEKIEAFLYRYATSIKSTEIFSIVNIQDLRMSAQESLKKHLHYLLSTMNITANIVVLTEDADIPINKELLNLSFSKYNIKPMTEAKIKLQIQNLKFNVRVVTSTDSGYGKNTFNHEAN